MVRPTIYPHTCKPFCSWFAPPGGWDKLYAAYTLPTYTTEYDTEEEEGEEEEWEEEFPYNSEEEYESDGELDGYNVFDDLAVYVGWW